jgi:hypothetical protein
VTGGFLSSTPIERLERQLPNTAAFRMPPRYAGIHRLDPGRSAQSGHAENAQSQDQISLERVPKSGNRFSDKTRVKTNG